MKVKVKIIKIEDIKIKGYKGGLNFQFFLEEGDKKISKSLNAGKRDIRLKTNSCNFYFKNIISLPHPDIVAFTSLKIISPFIGEKINFENGVSAKMADEIYKKYPFIKNVNVNKNLVSYSDRDSIKDGETVISFSGGADSVGAAGIVEKGTKLILNALVEHTDKNVKFNNPNSTDAQIKTIKKMPRYFNKEIVYTDFPYMTGNDRT